jgi:hypothetical protein
MEETVNGTNYSDLERGNQENTATSPDETNNFFSRIFCFPNFLFRYKKKENMDEIESTTEKNIYGENLAISPDGSVVATFNPCKL